MKKIVLSALLLGFLSFLNAQSHFSTQSHQALVTNIEAVADSTGWDTAFFSAGEDGFLIRWGQDNQGEHYQISDVGIKLMRLHLTEMISQFMKLTEVL